MDTGNYTLTLNSKSKSVKCLTFSHHCNNMAERFVKLELNLGIDLVIILALKFGATFHML